MSRLEAPFAIGILLISALVLPSPSARADDPALNLEQVRAAIRDRAIPAPERARRALEAATALDQQARREASPAERRARWAEAVGLLDLFLSVDANAEAAPMILFQGGVHSWAAGRVALDEWEFRPQDKALHESAINDLDGAIRRFRLTPLITARPGDPVDALGQNVRFRLAQALADRARLRPEADPLRSEGEREAQKLLDPPPTNPALRGYALMLKAELSNRLSQFGRAAIEIDEAEKCDPSPPLASIVEAKVASLCGRMNYEEARNLIKAGAGKVEPSLQALLMLRVELARRKQTSPGRARDAIDAEAFRVALPLRGSNRPEARRALIELAREVNQAPADAPADWWDVLAEGHLRQGDPARAGRLLVKAADRAASNGQADQAATLRYKGGACLFEAEKFVEGAKLLAQVADAPAPASKSPGAVQAKAGMLRALALGRAVALGQPGASRDEYLSALEAQVRRFGDDPSSGEARWLLGRVRWNAGRRDDAINLWTGIAHGHPRWLESRSEVAAFLREAVEDQAINHDGLAIKRKMDQARGMLHAAQDRAIEGSESTAVGLAQARLELVPDAGDPAEALLACERVLKGAARPDQHRLARLYRVVALAETNRFVDAESTARAEAKAADLAESLPVLRLLDRAASDTESEAARRRIGLILQVFTARLAARPEDIPSSLRDQVRLRHVRALLFAGNNAGARKELLEWGGASGIGDNEFLRELADTYLRLDGFVMAIEVEKLRSSRLKPGTIPWFEARYGLALASYRAGKSKDARQIIDATAILHPDLGGGDLRPRFDRLRQRIEQE